MQSGAAAPTATLDGDASFDKATMLAGVGKASRKAKNQSLRLFPRNRVRIRC
jgi:hypothetical protein